MESRFGVRSVVTLRICLQIFVAASPNRFPLPKLEFIIPAEQSRLYILSRRANRKLNLILNNAPWKYLKND